MHQNKKQATPLNLCAYFCRNTKYKQSKCHQAVHLPYAVHMHMSVVVQVATIKTSPLSGMKSLTHHKYARNVWYLGIIASWNFTN